MLSEFQKASSLVFNTAPGFLSSDKFLQKTLILIFFFCFLFNLNKWQQQRPLAWDREGGCRPSSPSVLWGAAAAASPVHDISVLMSRRWLLAFLHHHSHLLLVSELWRGESERASAEGFSLPEAWRLCVPFSVVCSSASVRPSPNSHFSVCFW